MKNTIKKGLRYFLNIIDTPAVILIYHRINNLNLDPQELAVTPQNFADQLQHLKKRYFTIDVEEFTDIIIRRKKIPKDTVVVTFDDGYADNYYEALPILESFNSQAIFYVSTSNLDTKKEFWWDDLERIFLLKRNLPVKLEIDVKNNLHTFSTDTDNNKLNTYNALHPIIKNCNPEERNNLIEKILRWANLNAEGRESHRVLTIDELTNFSKSKAVTIGAHTHSHPKLSLLSYTEQFNEINASKKILQDIVKKQIKHFSYPFGQKEDFNTNSIKVCKDLEFEMVCANYYSQTHRWHSRYALPRMLVRNWTDKEFELKMQSFF